jgi:hypothetical protein
MGRHPEAVNPDRARVVGVDVARGLALLGMFAVHIFPTFTADGGPAVATLVAGGRSAATFVLVAGIGLAFVSGGRHVVRGADRLGVAAGLVVRAALIGSLGLVLGVLSEDNRIYGILPYYGLYFLLAVPLIGLSARALAVVAAVVAVLGPVLLVATADVDLPGRGWGDGDPTFGALFADPGALLLRLTVTGSTRRSSSSPTCAPGWRSGGSTSARAAWRGRASVSGPGWRSRRRWRRRSS